MRNSADQPLMDRSLTMAENESDVRRNRIAELTRVLPRISRMLLSASVEMNTALLGFCTVRRAVVFWFIFRGLAGFLGREFPNGARVTRPEHSEGRDIQHRCNCTPGQPGFVPQPDNLVSSEDASRPADPFASRACCADPHERALADHLALKLGDGGEHLQQKATRRVRSVRVEALRRRYKTDAVPGQFSKLLV